VSCRGFNIGHVLNGVQFIQTDERWWRCVTRARSRPNTLLYKTWLLYFYLHAFSSL